MGDARRASPQETRRRKGKSKSPAGGPDSAVVVRRKTRETAIELSLVVRGRGDARIETPVGFFSHMLEALAKHGRFDLAVRATGDVEVDYHHTVEDVGIVLGTAFDQALGERRGIRRFGAAFVPMDEALARAVVDLSGRSFVVFEAAVDRKMLLVKKDFPFVLVEEFFRSFAGRGKFNLHVDLIRGRNGHHAAEAIFKAVALALREAVSPTGGADVPSTKGVL